MKKINFILIILISVLVSAFFSCTTLKQLGLAPSISLENVSIASLDLEGITFNCNYSVSNPLPVSVSIKKVSADVLCNENKFTSLSADEGVNLTASGRKSNAFKFKVPYETIISFAKKSNSSSDKYLPFKINGSASLDLGNSAIVQNLASDLPFTVSFNVPVFKPAFSLSSPVVKLPSLNALKDAFVASGMNVVKAASLAGSIAAGKQIAETAFDGVNLDIDLVFNLNVSNSGFTAWKYILKNCSLKTDTGNPVLLSASDKEITSKSASIPVTVKLNTVSAGKFIVQILNKKGTNPVFSFDSAISFPELSYASDLPLAYSKEILLGSFTVGK
ncbi:hypothetical protein [Treponema sp.]|uniref:hypothetical protein n=1 Tax=Treponema sp. TaxID=166 RepID=UPI00388D8CFA